MTIRLLPARLSRDRLASTSREKAAAAMLLAFALAAVIWANSPWASTYSVFWNTAVGLRFGGAHAELTLRQLVNDALMAFFFFTVGLEVKAQFTIGELTDRARAVVPVVAAVAGLTLPAVIFLAFNHAGDNARAWGVVISTDTAFVLGALAVIAPKYPLRLRTFLTTLAIVDDVGALLVIALFYAKEVRIAPLLVALALIILLVLVRYLPAARGPAYALLAVGLWLTLQFGGVHPTLAGVAVALAIPAFTPERRRVEQVVDLIRAFRQSPNSDYARAAARSLRDALSINERLQTAFAPYVSIAVLPVFALANAGVRLDRETVSAALRSPLTLGIVTGLVVGKFVGITGATALVHYTRIGRLSPGLTLRRVAGGAALCGIGFTIALFIVDLAIADPARQDQARVGVLVASAVSFVLGWAIFRVTDWLSPPKPVGAFLVRPVDPERDHIRGRPDAPLTLVEYGDFECPFCSRATGSIDEVRARLGDQLRYVWRHLPLERVHPHAMDAARAAEAAGLQGRFFDLGQVMFENQDNLGWEDVYRYANDTGLDLEQFNDDVHSSSVRHRVEDDAQDAEVMDLNSTPTFFIGGKRHKGPFDAATLIRALEESGDVSSTT
ncbi:Na+/H+ antiporter NhaA [Mycobacterium sp.]|uniref:Na+/H+ antiporter NhaA n=1 Tax=Mycobacterium sp. TaxID=1785 RepID=UPI002B8D0DFC|nr:Na+/H+ antiporter NhaA [Mycobacterium sp.]HME49129.1 Na+/H+ antiporter NhaA [Mycobacterium sp.]